MPLARGHASGAFLHGLADIEQRAMRQQRVIRFARRCRLQRQMEATQRWRLAALARGHAGGPSAVPAAFIISLARRPAKQREVLARSAAAGLGRVARVWRAIDGQAAPPTRSRRGRAEAAPRLCRGATEVARTRRTKG